MFDNFFGTFDGRHLLLLVLLGIGVTVFVIARSPKAPEQSETEVRQTALGEFTTHEMRLCMTEFILDVLGYGLRSVSYTNVRRSADKHNEFYMLNAALTAARRRLGIDASILADNSSEAEDACDALADDTEFVLACAEYIDFINHLVDLTFSVKAPTGCRIPESEIPGNDVTAAYRQLSTAIKSRYEHHEVYEQFTSFTQRAVVANFVANILGYGYNSYAYLRLQQELEEGDPVRLRLRDAIENVIRIHRLSPADWSSYIDDRLNAILSNDRGFILSCAYDIEAIIRLADLARTFADKPRNLHVPEDNPLSAFCDLRDYLWPSEDATYEEPHGGQ